MKRRRAAGSVCRVDSDLALALLPSTPIPSCPTPAQALGFLGMFSGQRASSWLCSPQGHLHDRYGQLVNVYTKLLLTKISFHLKVASSGLVRLGDCGLCPQCPGSERGMGPARVGRPLTREASASSQACSGVSGWLIPALARGLRPLSPWAPCTTPQPSAHSSGHLGLGALRALPSS